MVQPGVQARVGGGATINSQAEIIRGKTGSAGQSVIIVGIGAIYQPQQILPPLLSSARPPVLAFMNYRTRYSQRKPIMIWSILTNLPLSPPMNWSGDLDSRIFLMISLVLFLTDVSKHTNCIMPGEIVEWQNYIFIQCKTKLEKSGTVYWAPFRMCKINFTAFTKIIIKIIIE